MFRLGGQGGHPGVHGSWKKGSHHGGLRVPQGGVWDSSEQMEFHQSSAFNPGSCLPWGFPSSSAVPLWLSGKELACSVVDTGDMDSWKNP